MSSRSAFLASLPRKRVTAGALIRDRGGRVLLVEPTNRPDWLTPGGTVEHDESPRQGAIREVREELGIDVPIGRALVMQWVKQDDDPDGVLHFAYDGGVVDDDVIDAFRLPPGELRAYRFFAPSEISTVASPDTSARVAAAIDALARDSLIEIVA